MSSKVRRETNADTVKRPYARYEFSFHEHDWMGEIKDAEAAEAAFRRAAEVGRWEHVRHVEGDPRSYSQPHIWTVDDLAASLRALLADEYNLPTDIADAPIAKLNVLLGSGWLLRGGSITEFAGNNCDTTLEVILEKPTSVT